MQIFNQFSQVQTNIYQHNTASYKYNYNRQYTQYNSVGSAYVFTLIIIFQGR